MSLKAKYIFIFVSLFILLLTFITPLDNLGNSSGDILPFWAASRITMLGANMYDASLLLSVIQSVDPTTTSPSLVYNPPGILSIIAPFGTLPFNIFARLWLALSISIITWCCYKLYISTFFKKEIDQIVNIWERKTIFPVILLITFFPIYYTLILGQLVPILFLCLTVIILLLDKPAEHRSYFLIGMLLSVLTIKPHLFSLILLYFLLFTITKRKYKGLFGLCLGIGIIHGVIPLLLQADIYRHYFEQASVVPLQWKTPCIGAWLLHIFSPKFYFLRFTPIVLGGLGLTVRFIHRAPKELSIHRFHALTIYSLLVAPYCWTYDFIFLVPALLWIVHRLLDKDQWKMLTFLGIIGIVSFIPENMFFHVTYIYVLLMIQVLAIADYSSKVDY